MAKVKDIALVNSAGIDDLAERDGDLFAVESDTQHVKDILNSFPGWWKRTPALGVGIARFTGSPDKRQELVRSIKINLKSDNYRVDNVIVNIDGKNRGVYVSGEREPNT